MDANPESEQFIFNIFWWFLSEIRFLDLQKFFKEPLARNGMFGVSAERRHLKIEREMFAAVCRRAVTEQENRPPSP
jgi:hypothetical protein